MQIEMVRIAEVILSLARRPVLVAAGADHMLSDLSL
jgi:hypothetical protein